MNKISHKLIHNQLVGAALSDAQFLESFLSQSPLSRVMQPIELKSNTQEETIKYNKPTHFIATQKIHHLEPILKVCSDDTLHTWRVYDTVDTSLHQPLKNIEEITEKLLGDNPNYKSSRRLGIYLKYLVEFFGSRLNVNSNKTPALDLSLAYMLSPSSRANVLDLPQNIARHILFAPTDQARYEAHIKFFESLASRFSAVFRRVEKIEILPAFLASRDATLNLTDDPFTYIDPRDGIGSSPVKTFFRPSFSPNVIIDNIWDFTVNKRMLVFASLRDIEPGEPLTINYENKSALNRQFRLLHGPRPSRGKQPFRRA